MVKKYLDLKINLKCYTIITKHNRRGVSMKNVSLLWRKVQRPVLLSLVLIYLVVVWTGLYWISKGIWILFK